MLLISSPVKRLVTISLRFLEFVFGTLNDSAKSWQEAIAAS